MSLRSGVVRHRLELDESEAQVVRTIYRLYVCESGAKGVARQLNQLGSRMRSGRLWSKDAVLWLLDQSAASGTLRWGRCRRGDESDEGPSLAVPPIIDRQTYELAQELRARREPSRSGGRSAAKPHLLTGHVRCGRCGASYQLETSGKRANGTEYRYCYYNCRRSTRSGVEACIGYRIATDRLDSAVLEALANAVCSSERVEALAAKWHCEPARLRQAWRAVITTDPEVGRAYLLHVVERVEVHEHEIIVTPKRGGRMISARALLDDTT